MFIGDIRNCKTQEKEKERVDKELAHIREKFASKSLDGYGKKKYVWKLLYIYMLGYEVEIGHMEAMQMITSSKYTEKIAGYTACSILLNETHQLLRMIIQSIKNDLNSRDDTHQCLALTTIANVGGQEFAESLTGDVQKLLFHSGSNPYVRKKASLALLRLFRKFPEVIPQEEGFAERMLQVLEENKSHLGVLNCATSLLLGIVSHTTTGYESGVSKAIRLLGTLCFSKDIYLDYRYYQTICPWLQVKLLRFLQYFPPPTDPEDVTKLNEVLNKVLTTTEVTKSVNKNNADHGILFEAVNLIIHMCIAGVTTMHGQAIALLGKFISVKEPNIRYLGLDCMARLTLVPGTLASLKRHQGTVHFSLNDADVSIRKRALDLMYFMCDNSNVTEIVDELMKQLEKTDFQIKEELVLKIAILAEKFAKDLPWYIDTVLQLITVAGDFISEDIWFRAVQIVTNNEDIQEYAASKVYRALQNPNIHENGVKVGGYILGEFGHQIKDETINGEKMFEVVHSHFKTASFTTKAILLSSYVKMSNTFPELRERVNAVFSNFLTSADTELQQRALEYLNINQPKNDQLMTAVFEIMPNFPERESVLLKKVKKASKNTADRNIWTDDKPSEEKKEETKKEESEESDGGDSDVEKGEKEVPEEDKVKHSVPPQDLLGAFDTTEFVAASPRSRFPAQDAAAVSRLVGKNTGVVYDSNLLQIGMKVMAGTGSQTKMILYYGNRSNSSISDLKLELLSESGGVKMQRRPEEPLEVESKKQVPHYVLWTIQKPFEAFPKLKLTFTYESSPQEVTLQIPVNLTHFVAPAPQDGETFISAWKKNGNAEIKVIQSPNVIDTEPLKQLVLEGMNFSLIEGVEKDANNFSVSGLLHTNAKGPNDQNITIPCLMRFETKPGTKFVRVTVRSGHRGVSTGLVACISHMLS